MIRTSASRAKCHAGASRLQRRVRPRQASPVADIDALTQNRSVKEQLIRNGEAAIAAGVFGVPTFVADGNLFWGSDSLGMLLAYLGDPGLLHSDEMRRISDLPVGAERKP